MPRSEPAVHQLVGYLSDFAPERLGQLQRAWPGEQVLQPGRVLGALSAPWRIRLEVAVVALLAMAEQADVLSHHVSRRLRRSHRLEFLGQFVALLGSTGVLAAVVGDAGDRFKLASALLGLVGSTVALGVKFTRRDLSGADNGLAAQHRELTDAGGNAVTLAAQLQPHLRSGDDLGDPAALSALVEQANALAGRLYTLMKRTGAAVAPPVFTTAASSEAKAAS